jgi:hypothetical protein
MRLRKALLRIFLVVALLAIVLAVCVRGLVVSDPKWYRPVVLDEAAQVRGQKKFLNQIADLRNEVGKAQVTPEFKGKWPAFEIEFTEEEINASISRWQFSPLTGDALKQVSEPHVRFLKDRIEFAGRPGGEGPLVNIELSVEQTPEGPLLTLGRPWAGRMPLTRSLLDRFAAEVESKLRSAKVPEATIVALEHLIAGDPVEPVVAVQSSVVGQRELLPARIEKLSIGEGLLRATLRPFDPKDEPAPPVAADR